MFDISLTYARDYGVTSHFTFLYPWFGALWYSNLRSSLPEYAIESRRMKGAWYMGSTIFKVHTWLWERKCYLASRILDIREWSLIRNEYPSPIMCKGHDAFCFLYALSEFVGHLVGRLCESWLIVRSGLNLDVKSRKWKHVHLIAPFDLVIPCEGARLQILY